MRALSCEPALAKTDDDAFDLGQHPNVVGIGTEVALSIGAKSTTPKKANVPSLA